MRDDALEPFQDRLVDRQVCVGIDRVIINRVQCTARARRKYGVGWKLLRVSGHDKLAARA